MSSNTSVRDDLPLYDITQSYDWNYAHAPEPVVMEIPAVPGEWKFCGLPVDSPLGMPAGPLLNGKWCLYYASLGFDVLTYKTVRSREWPCYDLPNLQPVHTGQLHGTEPSVPTSEEMEGSWAVSFGMPSKSPDIWRADVQATRDQLPPGKLLSVSVVGSPRPKMSIEELAEDYAQCARWAVESGADCVETNFSCPNVATCDGQLYQQPESARFVAETVRAAIGPIPYIVKIGHLPESDLASELLTAISSFIDALSMTNCIATTVQNPEGEKLFSGAKRGIGGEASRRASIAQVRLMKSLIDQQEKKLNLIGVGGIFTADHVQEYLQAGAHAVHIATAAMLKPNLAIEIREALAKEAGSGRLA